MAAARALVTALRHLLSILLLPTVVTVVVPRWILGTFESRDSRWPAALAYTIPKALGAVIGIAGLGLVIWCISLFARVGKGTLAPWDPTSKLVAVGPYRYTRNPMISGVAAILIGETLVIGSWRLALWAATFVVLNHVFFLGVEEPGLVRRFGQSYVDYRNAVPRWIPRRPR